MNQQELYKALEATCLFGTMDVGTNYIQCGKMFRFELNQDNQWRVLAGCSGSYLPHSNIVEVLLLDLFANELVQNWFPQAEILEYNKKWSLSEGILLENDDGCWTLFVEGEVIENGVLYNCVTRLLGICEAIV